MTDQPDDLQRLLDLLGSPATPVELEGEAEIVSGLAAVAPRRPAAMHGPDPSGRPSMLKLFIANKVAVAALAVTVSTGGVAAAAVTSDVLPRPIDPIRNGPVRTVAVDDDELDDDPPVTIEDPADEVEDDQDYSGDDKWEVDDVAPPATVDDESEVDDDAPPATVDHESDSDDDGEFDDDPTYVEDHESDHEDDPTYVEDDESDHEDDDAPVVEDDESEDDDDHAGVGEDSGEHQDEGSHDEGAEHGED